MNKAVFLDRDGTVIHDCGYLDNVEDVKLLPMAGHALRKLKEAGFLLVLVTNQSGIGRGFFNLDMVHKQHQRLKELLAHEKVQLDAIEICPHAPEENCECRKPSSLMLERAAAKLDVDLNKSFMLGDKSSDIEAGRAAGCKTVFIKSQKEETSSGNLADFRVTSINEAAECVKENS